MAALTAPPRVFIDASAFVALFREQDVNHRRAITFTSALLEARAQVITSEIVIAETLTVLSMRAGKRAALSFWDWLEEEDLDVRTVEADMRDRAFEIFARHPSKNFPFFDAISLAFMEREGITHAFSFDRHFPKRLP